MFQQFGFCRWRINICGLRGKFKTVTLQECEAVTVGATERFIYLNHEYITGHGWDGVYGNFGNDHAVRGDPGRVQQRRRESKVYFPGFQGDTLHRFPDIHRFPDVVNAVSVIFPEKERARFILGQVPYGEFGRTAIGGRIYPGVKEMNFIVRRVKGATRTP